MDGEKIYSRENNFKRLPQEETQSAKHMHDVIK
jgi:hypothetical protein